MAANYATDIKSLYAVHLHQ